MPAYVLADVQITDPTQWEDYRARVGPTLDQYGGKILVRSSKGEVLEGDMQPHLLVIAEFARYQRAIEWYPSPEYAPLIALRKRAANTQVVLVEGL